MKEYPIHETNEENCSIIWEFKFGNYLKFVF